MKSFQISCFLILIYFNLSTQETSQIPRIINGVDAYIEDLNWQVQVLDGDRLICGGTIVSEQHVVSAAHCFEFYGPSTLRIIAGSSIKQEGGISYKVEKVINHPEYDTETNDFDAAVVKIRDGIFDGPTMVPIPLTDVSDRSSVVGQEALVSGWGQLKTGIMSDHLQKVYVPILDQTVCEDSYDHYLVSSNMICAGYLDGTKDACVGDSGGPLILNEQLFGIVSWGIGCADLNRPGVYTYIPEFKDWILQTIEETS